MKKIRCIAIDDEPIALSIIEEYCERRGDMELSLYSDPADGYDAICRSNPEIVMLDIALGEVNGMEIARKLSPETCLIFTTAYMEYAKEGFDMDAVDYLQKPFSYERFSQAIERSIRRMSYSKERQKTIVVKQEYNNVTIDVEEIVYAEAMENYVKIFRIGGVCTISRTNLKGLMEILPAGEFLRIHRSYVVSVGKILRYTRRRIELENGVVLPVGRQYVPDVVSCIKDREL